MDFDAGWSLDDRTLRPVPVDVARIEAALAAADPVERLVCLAALGRHDEGLAEAAALLRDPPDDPWALLLQAAELRRLTDDLAGCEELQLAAWKHARSRIRQAGTLQSMGRRWFDAGDLDTAAQHFELALTMRQGFADRASVAESEQALRACRGQASFDAIVLAGGSGVRLGGQSFGAKALIPLAGWPLADHVLLAASAATVRVQVGPTRVALGHPRFAREDPLGMGPVAGIAAALEVLAAPLVAVLAADLPFIGSALNTLRCAVADRDAAALVDTTGRINYLAAVWRTDALRAVLAKLPAVVDAPVRALYRETDVAYVPDFDAASADVDTPADLIAATERIRRRNRGQLPAALLAWPRLELHAPS